MAALIALNFDDTLDENVASMEDAASQVETGEITRAVRDAKVNGIDVKEGAVIGLHNNSLVTTGDSVEDVAWNLLELMSAKDRELITVYWGGELQESDAQRFREEIAERYPDAEVELVNGGQPFYDYIISAE
jgi:dihydroxyacetone kinase-like predicted kinase